jgi:hypothetical protein
MGPIFFASFAVNFANFAVKTFNREAAKASQKIAKDAIHAFRGSVLCSSFPR